MRVCADIGRGVVVGALVLLSVIGGALADAAPTNAPSGRAAAVAENEPNDSIFQISGVVPVDGVRGALQTSSDVDTFALRLRPQRQVTLNYTLGSGCGDASGIRFSLRTPGGDSIGAPAYTSSFSGLGSAGGVRSYSITTPGVFGGPSTDYWLRFFADGASAVGCTYQFSVTAAGGGTTDAIDPTPTTQLPLVVTAEPNDLDAQAIGPLSGDTQYQGGIETANDVDALWVPVKAGTAVTLTLSAANGEAVARLYDRTAGSSKGASSSFSAESGEAQSSTPSAATADVSYLVRITGDTGATWRLVATPASSIGVSPPPPPTPAPTPAPLQAVSRSLSIARVGGRYRGRVFARQSECYSNVVVSIRRRGKSAIYATTTSRSDGSWTVARRALPGKVYAQVNAQTVSAFACGAASSGSLRRR